MDIEYHYYITYLIAITAGFSDHQAYKIAWSSQLVDNNKQKFDIYKFGRSKKITSDYIYQNIITQLSDINLSTEESHKILPVFHFLPGNFNSVADKRKDNKTHTLNTTPGSFIAKKILREALKSRNMYRIGIASHSFVDTWAHQNFIGSCSKFNAMPEIDAKLLPNIGHLDAKNNPDLIGLIWHDNRLKNPMINNAKRFLSASKSLLLEYSKSSIIQKNNKIDTNKFLQKLCSIFKLVKRRDSVIDTMYLQSARIDKYQKLAEKYTTLDIIPYDKDVWFNDAVRFDKKKEKYIWRNESYKDSNWYQFQEAAKFQLEFIWKFIEKRLNVSYKF